MRSRDFWITLAACYCVLCSPCPSPAEPLHSEESEAEIARHIAEHTFRPAFFSPVTPEEVAEAQDYFSLPSVVASLKENPDNWNMVLEQVAACDSFWLHVTRELLRGMDAESARQYTTALALALPECPGIPAGMASGGHSMSALWLCTLPFDDPDPQFLAEYGTESWSMWTRAMRNGFSPLAAIWPQARRAASSWKQPSPWLSSCPSTPRPCWPWRLRCRAFPWSMLAVSPLSSQLMNLLQSMGPEPWPLCPPPGS